MALLTTGEQAPVKPNPLVTILRVSSLLIAVIITVAAALGRDRIADLPVLSYPAVFVVSVIGNASVFLPAPVFAIVAVAAPVLSPISVGIVAGLGATIGELTGYLAGMSGHGIAKKRKHYDRISGWMDRSGMLALFLLAAVPNFFFDVGGLIAGAVRMPLWRFMVPTWIGKSLRLIVVGYVAAKLF